jgi:hypothetical protein
MSLELSAERGIEVDHVSVYIWVRRFTRLFIDAARPYRPLEVTAGLSMRPTDMSASTALLPSRCQGHRRGNHAETTSRWAGRGGSRQGRLTVVGECADVGNFQLPRRRCC